MRAHARRLHVLLVFVRWGWSTNIACVIANVCKSDRHGLTLMRTLRLLPLSGRENIGQQSDTKRNMFIYISNIYIFIEPNALNGVCASFCQLDSDSPLSGSASLLISKCVITFLSVFPHADFW